MCNNACLDFIADHLEPKEATKKDVLEVGARDVNGSIRPYVEGLKPRHYTGVDIEAGKGVDQVCDAVDLIERFGESMFHLVITTEMMEHVEDWKTVIHNLKGVLRSNGVLFLTTRSKGFPFHGYPSDYWRYEIADMQAIFSDFEILILESDPSEPGVFLKARKPADFVEVDLSGYTLYSMQEKEPEPKPEQTAAPVENMVIEGDKPVHQWGIA